MHETAYISNIDLQYASGQFNIHRDAVGHCNFNLISGDMTGTYRFRTVFYGLTDMPAQIQKSFDWSFIGLQNTYCFLDDLLIVSRGKLEDLLDLVKKK